MYVVYVVYKAVSELGLDDDAYKRQARSRMRIVAISNVRINKARQ
jgi:hypothetical protein